MIEHFFTPVSIDVEPNPRKLSGSITPFKDKFPNLANETIVVFGVYDSSFTRINDGTPQYAFAQVRDQLYNLYNKFPGVHIADIGNLIPGDSIADTVSAVGIVVNELASQGIVSLIFTNAQIAALGQYMGFDSISKHTEVTLFDNKVSIHDDELVYRIVSHEPNHLFNLNHFGYQTYLSDDEAIQAFEKMYFDTVRLGVLRGNTEIAEPALRNSKVCGFDLGCIKKSDAPGGYTSGPNGITPEDACQIARFAGISPKLFSMGIHGYSGQSDTQNITAQLVAQMAWFFIEGVSQRKNEDPVKEPNAFLQYRTALNEGKHEIVFYKSKTTARWWMEIPHPKNNKENTFPIVVPCSYSDYQVACNNEMPDRWWRVFQKYT